MHAIVKYGKLLYPYESYIAMGYHNLNCEVDKGDDDSDHVMQTITIII